MKSTRLLCLWVFPWAYTVTGHSEQSSQTCLTLGPSSKFSLFIEHRVQQLLLSRASLDLKTKKQK